MVVSIEPDGDTRVAFPGKSSGTTVNPMASLHGPLPPEFQVWIHQVTVPAEREVAGVTEQVPVPPEQPALAALYQLLILFPVLSLT